ncbi:unnamed protein product [Staurois parvus]|uniref:Uncharacterized protein n=1 Tax=Staurois parvus TaxID=386267 RepID=A0ABN9GXF3_9NEOB|nr:unnamed protein product [Staurois parvus]
MSNERYTSEEVYRILSMSGESKGEDSLTQSASEYEPVDSSGTLTGRLNDREEVSGKIRCTRPHEAEVLGSLDLSHMQQSASTSTALPFGELASTSGLVCPGLFYTSTAVSLGDVASPISAVQAAVVASTSIVPQPPRIRTQAFRTPSVLPDLLANPDWQPTDSAAPVLPPFTAQPRIQVVTAHLTTPLEFMELFFTEDLYNLILAKAIYCICSTIYRRKPKFNPCQTIRMETHYGFRM